MVLKFKYIFIIQLFIFSFLHPNRIAIFYENLNTLNTDNSRYILYIINIIEENSNKEVSFHLIRDQVIILETKKMVSFINNNNFEAFIIINENISILELLLFDNKGNTIGSKSFSLNFVKEENFNSEIKKITDDIFNFITINYINKKKQNDNVNDTINFHKTKNKLKFEFPNVNFGISGVSYKIFNDKRSNIFSIFPINLLFSFYPHSNIETGLFFRFSYNSSIALYRNVGENSYNQKLIYFDIEYGFFIGFSSIFEQTIFSIGFSFFNKTFFLEENDPFKIKNNLNNYFLPEISLYQKINVRLINNIYYTVFINIKSAQIYEYSNPYFYGNFFDYNLLVLELSFFGVSVIF
ncbi:MAG: hypothetical protein A2015_16345 [Spirochaetes bacterium GWF1_31_7]|nr:MAG: hypothetical protein A2Y30_13710 [Spirochaetes bacterium GWE1_32_154]OHD50019.1 MAG: hypothetical protein A2Y29_11755 [Spirochaetes bacterium GWE2_31_10]OHD52333.1 MAG: hypothetical protein A2015_16345 [Spirochaetes bacterium GWF1_31_7]HBI38484.1 hypothetical protein [Spirochaetia bacterium]